MKPITVSPVHFLYFTSYALYSVIVFSFNILKNTIGVLDIFRYERTIT